MILPDDDATVRLSPIPANARERLRFESWALLHGYDISHNAFDFERYGYSSRRTNEAWIVWVGCAGLEKA